MATRVSRGVFILTDYTQAEENTLALQLVGASAGSRVVFNTEIPPAPGVPRIWNGAAFENVPTDLNVLVPLATSTLQGGIPAFGSAMQVMRVNAGGTALEFASLTLPAYCRVTGSNATTTGQTLVDVTGLTVSLVANAVYEIEAVLSCQTTGTAGIGYGIQFTGAGATIEAHITGAATTTASKTLRINAFNTSSQAWLTSSAQTGGVIIKGTVTVGANAGTLSVRHLKVTSGTSTVFIGSYLRVTRIS